MKALVTGACGFAGSHLVELLLSKGETVFAATAPGESTANLAHIKDRIEFFTFDLKNKRSCFELVQSASPDVVFHLAGVAFLPDAQADPGNLFAVNVGGTYNLAQAVCEHVPSARFLYVSSGEVYGHVPQENMPINERQAIAPANPYAFSKIFAENLLVDAVKKRGLNLCICRPFTHIGPRQRSDFVASSFARQIANIEAGKSEPVIRVGNLSSKRDFMDVKDMAAAYYAAAKSDATGPFNIATGKPVPIQTILDTLVELSTVSLSVEVDPTRLRPVDLPVLAGDPTAFKQSTGWEPKVPLEQSLKKLLDYWRKQE